MIISVPSAFTIAEYAALAASIPVYCPTATFVVNGQTLTAAQAVTLIQSILSTATAVSTAKTGLTNARAAEEQAVVQNGATVKLVRDVIAAMFNNDATALAAFKIVPKKPRAPLSAAARAAATAKSIATREARGTTSKKQKAAITGNVTGVTITPVTIPSAAPTASTPVPAPVVTPSGSTSSVSPPAAPATNGVGAPAAVPAAHA